MSASPLPTTTSRAKPVRQTTCPTRSRAKCRASCIPPIGFQCGIGDTRDCAGQGYGSIVWPTTTAQPGMLRLHDAGTHWSTIDQGNGVYNWTPLDNWLDLIAQHQPVKVSQVF